MIHGYNYAEATTGHQGGGPCGIWAFDANNVTIAHSTSHHNHNGHPDNTSNDGCGFDLDGKRATRTHID